MSTRPRSPRSEHPEQLVLLDASDVPVQFRIDAATRRRGLAHVAELRQVLTEQAARIGLGPPHPGSRGPLAA
jgi:hypothetical protein